MKEFKVRISAVAWSDHYSRLYASSRTFIDGQWVMVFPVPSSDDAYAIERGQPVSGASIISIKEGKRLVTVVMTEAAVTEILSDFDFYSDMSGMGEYSDMADVVRAMRGAAKSIRKQIMLAVHKEVK